MLVSDVSEEKREETEAEIREKRRTEPITAYSASAAANALSTGSHR